MSQTQRQGSQSEISDDVSSDLEDEVYRIAEATNEDGTVDVTIKSVNKNGSKVTVTFQTPWLEEKEETMDWPKSDDSKYKIVRICENTIGSFTGLTQIKGVKAKADPDSWDIKAKQEENFDISDYSPHMKKYITSIVILGSISGILGMIGLVLAYPFGVSILNIWQGISVFVASIVMLIFGSILHDEL